MPNDEAKPLDIREALQDDKEQSLRRELAETREKLKTAQSRTCVSCGATFTKGEGHMCAKKKDDEKPKPKTPPADVKPPPETPPAPPPEKPEDDEDDSPFFL